MKRLSIGVRLTLWYLAIFALAQVLFGAGMWLILRHNLYDLVDDGLEAQVDDLKNFLQSQPKDRPIAKVQEEVNETYTIEHPGDYLAVYADDNQLIYRSAFLQAHQSALVPPDQVKRPIVRSRRIDHRPFRFLFQKLEVNGHVYTVEMGVPADDAVETLHDVPFVSADVRSLAVARGCRRRLLAQPASPVSGRCLGAYRA